MRRRFVSLTLTLVLLAFALAPAHAEGAAYSGQFADVPAGAWYYGSVARLYELGLTRGRGASDRYVPDGEVTVAEAVTLAARVRSLMDYGECEFGPSRYGGKPWYRAYLQYLQDVGALEEEFEGSYDRSATRAEVAHILASAMPDQALEERNDAAVTIGYASRRYITDVTDYTPYRNDILLLYRWGILSGMDRTGSFYPDQTIRRSQIAAMAARLADPDLRLTLDWDQVASYSREGATLAGLVSSDGSFHSAPDPADESAIDDNLRYMLSRGERQIKLDYGKGNLTEEMARDLLTANVRQIRQYLEQGYNEVKCDYSLAGGTVTLTFSSSLGDKRLTEAYRDAALREAITVHDQMWSQGLIHAGMTEYERARVYFTWLCVHCSYDYESTDASISHSGYGALVDGLAVCDGYTAAYNLLLKLEGISCSTWSTDSHIWTVAELDGETVHIDPTWGDQTGTVAYRYFAMTETVSLARFGPSRV